jgi:RNA 2',3'-cyclic 3'-phosphodiesterase
MSPRERKKFKKERPADPNDLSIDWRLFVAIPLPPNVVELVREIQSHLAKFDLPLRYVDPDFAHLTLHFLGDAPPERAELLTLALPKVVGRHGPILLRTAGMGVFPNPRKPRVLWLGLEGGLRNLQALHRDIGAALRSYDFPADDRPLQVHITVARARDEADASFPGDLERARREERIVDLLAQDVAFEANRVLLIRSILGRQGPRYQTIGEFSMTGNAR